MTSLLGLPLDIALKLVEAEGMHCSVESVQCNKGTGGSDVRVVRVRKGEGDCLQLLCSSFCTSIDKENDASD